MRAVDRIVRFAPDHGKRKATCMFGFLNVNKPANQTSRDVVNRIQRMVRPHKVGHAGTLDPLATGVLLVAIGRATRLVEYAQRMPKRYLSQFRLGYESDTEDVEGDVRELANPPRPGTEQVEAVLPRFTGEIEQVPPAYSALKVRGRRAYELARQGQQVELKPRPIVIHQIRVMAYHYPVLELDIRCGSGTYIRSLGRDIARSLGTEAIMSALQRTAIGDFSVGSAVELDDLTAKSLPEHLRPATAAVAALPSIRVSEAETNELLSGRRIDNHFEVTGVEIAAIDPHGDLVSILAAETSGALRPLRNFPR